jgi:hypothetical protein
MIDIPVLPNEQLSVIHVTWYSLGSWDDHVSVATAQALEELGYNFDTGRDFCLFHLV